MTTRGANAPAWLFSFVDLAFLLLIAMTQVGSRADASDLGEIVVPRLHNEAAADLPAQAGDRWQLRVHVLGTSNEGPFELIRSSDAVARTGGERIALDELRRRLAALRADAAEKPLLAPHRDSRSEDLLEAAGSLEELWPGRRRATVTPVLAGT